jgi:hypothetical protein
VSPPPGFAERATAAVLARPLVVTVPADTSSPPPKIGDTLSEAGEAIAKLSRSTAEKATPRALLPEASKVEPPKPRPSDAPPGTDAIAAMPSAAKSSLQPVTGSTRRAISLLLRDTGLKAD